MFEKIAFAAKRIISSPVKTKAAEELAMLSNSRVASSARASFKGSDAQRLEMSNKVLGDFYNNTKDVFIKNSEISQEQLEKELKKSFPGINLKCTPKDKSLGTASLQPFYDESKKTIIGYDMQLPFYAKSGKLFFKEQDAEHLYHETSHLGDYVYTPKSVAKFNTNRLNEKFPGFDKRVGDYEDFYSSKLYAEDSVGKLEVNGVKGLTKKEKYKKDIMELFNKPAISSEEKIEVLQDWRHSLQTELSAFPNGFKYDNKLAIEKAVKKYNGIENLPKDFISLKTKEMEKYTDLTINKDYSFADKKEVVEEILKNEIAKVRENSAKLYK